MPATGGSISGNTGAGNLTPNDPMYSGRFQNPYGRGGSLVSGSFLTPQPPAPAPTPLPRVGMPAPAPNPPAWSSPFPPPSAQPLPPRQPSQPPMQAQPLPYQPPPNSPLYNIMNPPRSAQPVTQPPTPITGQSMPWVNPSNAHLPWNQFAQMLQHYSNYYQGRR